jgi:hypothetical protein
MMETRNDLARMFTAPRLFTSLGFCHSFVLRHSSGRASPFFLPIHSCSKTHRSLRFAMIRFSLVGTFVVALVPAALFAVAPANFAGEYADKNFLNGQGVFQLSLEQNGTNVSVFFSAAHNDGRGAAPEADGTGKVTTKGTVEFKWEDSLKNAGNGTISRSGSDIIVSIKTTRVADARGLEFYRQNLRLKPAGKN